MARDPEPQPFDRRAIPRGFRFDRWRSPDGWDHRRYDWLAASSRPRGSLLFLTGRGDFAEKYLEAMHHWQRAGWSVAGFDWRGQGGSGRIVPGLVAGHTASFDPMIDDLAAFAAAWREASPAPHVVLGHSMGGHLVLRALAERRIAADAAVLIAPMLGLAAARAGRLAAFLAGLFGQAMRPIARDPDAALRQRYLTGSVERFEDAGWWKVHQEELGLGAPTWGWLHAAYDSIARAARRGLLEGVGTPVFIAAARIERLVTLAAMRSAVRRLPDARLTVYDGAHELLREDDAVRLRLLADIDAFLAEKAANPAPAPDAAPGPDGASPIRSC